MTESVSPAQGEGRSESLCLSCKYGIHTVGEVNVVIPVAVFRSEIQKREWHNVRCRWLQREFNPFEMIIRTCDAWAPKKEGEWTMTDVEIPAMDSNSPAPY